MAELIGMSGDIKGKTFSIEKDTFTIGRSPDNDVHIDNSTVSGHHARITREGDRYILTDLGSTNGTRVNAREAKDVPLKPKDLIQFGSIEFLFNAEGVAEEEETPSSAFSATEVVLEGGESSRPDSFDSISPFGARQKTNQGVWSIVIGVASVATLAVVAYYFFKLITTGH